MLNFAELKAKAGKAKDATVNKVASTRDKYTSAPTSRVNWDPNWKRATPPLPGSPRPAQTGAPPPPTRSRPDVTGTSTAVPTVPRASRPGEDMPPPPSYTPQPPPRRAASGYPPSHGQRDDAVEKIDWANLGTEDKEAFFGWLDEFFSRYLGIKVGPQERGSLPASGPASGPPVHRPPPVMSMKAPPPVNRTTRPQD